MTSSVSSSSDPLLSSLCPYCNAQPPKYRCPACSARTCSLACSKRHKIYSECTGVRDPSAFVKRSQLVQPSKLVQDYNYLLGVEKAITRGPVLKTGDPEIVREGQENDSADEGKNDEKVILGAGKLGDVEREKLAKHIQETRSVTVKQAPRGMKRARENDTVFTGGRRKKKTVRWTVEWFVYESSSITAEPKRMLSTRVQENRPLSEAFVAELHKNATSTFTSFCAPSPTALSSSSFLQPLSPPPQKASQPPPPPPSSSSSSSSKSSRRTFTSSCQFYLKAANVPANEPTLIELSPQEPLSTSLRGHVVFEFPTVIVVAKEAEAAFTGWKIVERSKVEKAEEALVIDNDKTITDEGGVGGEESEGDDGAPVVEIQREEIVTTRMESGVTTDTVSPAATTTYLCS